MDMDKEKGRKGLIVKTWERCRSFGGTVKKPSGVPFALLSKSRSWPRKVDSSPDNKQNMGNGVVPKGCFSVYVGLERERFFIKIEYANHPLFKVLLEEAEFEYGYKSDGPLALPCNVDMFYDVLLEICSDEIRPGCKLTKGFGASTLISSNSF